MAGLFVALLLLGGPVGAGVSWSLWKKLRMARGELKRFAPVVDVEEHVRNMEAESARTVAAASAAQQRQEELSSALQRQQEELLSEVNSLETRIDLHEVGLLAPRYDFGEAFEYKTRLDLMRDQQAATMKAGRAAECSSEWTISGSRAEGKKVTAKILKLMLRAFNGECDALVAKVKYDNIHAFEDRIRKSRESINKLGEGFSCGITEEYLDLKLHELHLTHEYQEKLHAEREEQRELREQMREEERAQKEFDHAQREAEQEEERYSRALARARQDAENAVGAKQQKLLEQVRELEGKLLEAEQLRQRAVSMAQLTKTGHVYILSNIGSFGEHVFKVGMTRRLVPQERVDELGDASVPFPFDVHAMISAPNAPALEKALHDLLDERRLNKVNRRKEFFHVTLDDIEQVVRAHHGEFKLTRQAEATEYRKSLIAAKQSARAFSRAS